MALGLIPQECPQVRPHSRRIRALLGRIGRSGELKPARHPRCYYRDAPNGARRRRVRRVQPQQAPDIFRVRMFRSVLVKAEASAAGLTTQPRSFHHTTVTRLTSLPSHFWLA